MTFGRERIADAWDEALPLLRENVEETGALPPEEFNPNRELLERFDGEGLLHTYVARVDGRIAGYAVMSVSPHLHFSATVWAIQEVLYVHPDHRGRLAWRFIDWQDFELAKLGTNVILRQVTTRKNYAPLLERLGYVKEATEYVRRVA